MKELDSLIGRTVKKLVSPKDECIRDFEVDRPKCSRCGSPMLEIQPCHYQCKSCGGVHDCADIASGG